MPGRREDRWPASLTGRTLSEVRKVDLALMRAEHRREGRAPYSGVVNEKTAPKDVPPELEAIAQK